MRRLAACRTLTATACAALMLAWPSRADETAAAQTLTIGITSGSPPYVFSIEDGKGLDLDILKVIFARMNVRPAFQPLPFARRELVLASGKVDAVTFWTKPKDVACSPSKPYRYWRNALFSVRKKDAPESSQPLGRTGIFMGSEHLRGYLKDIGIDYDSLQRVYTVNTGVRMMLYGRLDSYIGDYPTVVYNFHKEDPAGEYEADIRHFFPPMPQSLCFTSAAHAVAFDRALDSLLAENPEALSAITRAHGLSERITPPLNE